LRRKGALLKPSLLVRAKLVKRGVVDVSDSFNLVLQAFFTEDTRFDVTNALGVEIVRSYSGTC
jgi:hypothetical protein